MSNANVVRITNQMCPPPPHAQYLRTHLFVISHARHFSSATSSGVKIHTQAQRSTSMHAPTHIHMHRMHVPPVSSLPNGLIGAHLLGYASHPDCLAPFDAPPPRSGESGGYVALLSPPGQKAGVCSPFDSSPALGNPRWQGPCNPPPPAPEHSYHFCPAMSSVHASVLFD